MSTARPPTGRTRSPHDHDHTGRVAAALLVPPRDRAAARRVHDARRGQEGLPARRPHLIDTTGSTAGFRGRGRPSWHGRPTTHSSAAIASTPRRSRRGQGTIDWAVTADGCDSPETRRASTSAGRTSTTNGLGTEAHRADERQDARRLGPLGRARGRPTKLPSLTRCGSGATSSSRTTASTSASRVPAATIERLADEWTPRLRGLKGVTVIALHAGGASTPTSPSARARRSCARSSSAPAPRSSGSRCSAAAPLTASERPPSRCARPGPLSGGAPEPMNRSTRPDHAVK